ncbi:hypothetical protein HBI56_026790 [Parastagonospora nodorum]|uniref:Uncharacterized protein n=1 Tax=Phaeosphaeria nodorum (strain SN15 / ATCC MYA-4574 / FGSC 10173) TaxID=321614 RepID=A0A7U2F1E2_PHANO|nr:hypothetical protein HBH56_014440 [Parastagonospora nodorum]QRC94940.1 hypothetical protein JI435_026840 [Parastagonospora nodorum SN15]KAH3937506.1 hypothetical protein HBH54_020000 [Parastagonospora nodorum]KAH3953965.1 hypothetical protein HBH53_032400 [Parastagonospora nodorum]KAH3969329.1 hypothetical protein HBH51_124570 [Parastagonospora nodorum]
MTCQTTGNVIVRTKEFLRSTEIMLRSVSDRSRQPPNIISQEVTNLILRALKFERRTHKIHYLHRALLAVDLIGSDEYPDAHRITDDSLSVESDDSSEDSDDDGYRSHDRHPPRLHPCRNAR